MKYKKICKHCGKEFETNSPQKIYCDGPHYRPCPVCGEPVKMYDNDFSRAPRCCSPECSHKLRSSRFKKRKCKLCGKEFTPHSGSQIVCDDVHYDSCEICGKPFVRTITNLHDNITTCSRECTVEKMRRNSLKKYGTEHPMQSKEVQHNFHQAMMDKYGVAHALQIPGKILQQQKHAYVTNMKNNGVPYACLTSNCIEAQGHIVSNINRRFGQALADKEITYKFERRIDNKSYDLFVPEQNSVIEIDPSYTHSVIKNHYGVCLDKYYHRDKTLLAEKNGYRCIHVFDWDDWDKVTNMLLPKKHVYARKCTIYKLHPHVADEFLSRYHLQGTCRGQLLHLGLVIGDILYQVMTFGKARYNKKYDVELLRLCTLPGYSVIGGASRLFSYATNEYGLSNIISYCDRSKFLGDVYEKIGMKFDHATPPQEIWSKGSQKITANLLRAHGYDQLFKTNYGKGTSNEELMLEHGWLPVYDCGQRVYVFE